MKKEKVKKLRVRWRPRKLVAYITFVLIFGLIVELIFAFNFAQYLRLETWIMSCSIGIGVFLFISACIYFFIGLKSKYKIYHIDIEQKICTIKKRKIYYQRAVPFPRTRLQKVFGLVSVKLESDSEHIVLKDVSKEILEYL